MVTAMSSTGIAQYRHEQKARCRLYIQEDQPRAAFATSPAFPGPGKSLFARCIVSSGIRNLFVIANDLWLRLPEQVANQGTRKMSPLREFFLPGPGVGRVHHQFNPCIIKRSPMTI